MSSGSHSLRLTSLEQIEKDIAQALEHAGETGKVSEYIHSVWGKAWSQKISCVGFFYMMTMSATKGS